MKNCRMLVDGELLDAPDHMPVISPVTELTVGNAPRAQAATIDRAVAAAARAYVRWRVTPHAERRAALLAISGALAAHAEELAGLLVLETGRPMAIAQF